VDAMRDVENDSRRDAGTYEPPTLTVIGPVSEFTFGSQFSSNDAITQHGGHH
jgi:hypothetical protein